ncbi:hypothetical protein OCA96_05305 [Bacillus cereus]|nr:hypothetical protein [Bacillus cereus]
MHKQSVHMHYLLKQWSHEYKKTIYCLGFLRNKEPRHPLYTPAETEKINFFFTNTPFAPRRFRNFII